MLGSILLLLVAGAAVAPAGNADVGHALYLGARRFERGAAPCGACHAAGLGAGANFGPILSSSRIATDPALLDRGLEEQPWPTMKPLYADRSLSAAERADLGAYLRETAGKPPISTAAMIPDAIVIAAAMFGALMAFGTKPPPLPGLDPPRGGRT